MSEYGIKILNYSCGSIYEVNQGVRYKYDTTPAMLTNSLFKDFICANGLKVWKEESTRDIICINFDYGSRTFKQEIEHIDNLIKQNIDEGIELKSSGLKYQKRENRDERFRLIKLKKQALANKDKYVQKTKNELREDFYVNGVEIKYPKFNKQKQVVGYDVVHYKMLYRTPGKAKKGSCMFIKSSLYNKAHNYLTMGIKLPKHNAPIVEIGAYSSLVTSTIEDKIKIEPENILVLKDVDSFFNTNVISIEIDEDKHCMAIPKEDYRVKNTIFDGQALIDESIFPPDANGYVLLRQHFCKMAAFCTRIQDYFRDYFGDQYDTATVTDMWGNVHLAKDVKLITTNNAMKWLKFKDMTYEYWCKKVWDNEAFFGIVKTAHSSKLGDKQRMSYQMVNTLSMDNIDDVLTDSKQYINKLKTDDDVFLDYLQHNINYSNDYEVLVALCKHNPDFKRCDYYLERKRKIISNYLRDMKCGHIIQNADNLVIVGSPYAMLMHSVGEDPLLDPTFQQESDCIQCYTERFEDGEYLSFMRSPYNSQNNNLYLHNHYDEKFKKYFKLGKLILAINMIGTDAQDRGNGMDMDSDSGYVTNQPTIVAHAKYCYANYPTIVNNIPMESNKYDNTLINYAVIDNKLAAAQKDIGQSSNLAQICLSYSYNDNSEILKDYICILAVLAQCAIDNAKRSFDVNISEEIKRIKDAIDLKQNGYPSFWRNIRQDLNPTLINPNISCPMNEVNKLHVDKLPNSNVIPINELFISYENNETYKISKAVESLIEKYINEFYAIKAVTDRENKEEYNYLLHSSYDDLIDDIRRITLPDKYIGLMSWLINRAFMITPNIQSNKKLIKSQLCKNRATLLSVLYDLNPNMLLKCFVLGRPNENDN